MIDVLLIHADWCGHCKSLMPEWKKVKDTLKNNNNIIFHEIESNDSDKDHRLNELSKKTKSRAKIEIRGFPMILRLENSELTEYKGERTADKMAKWVTKHKLSGGKRKTKRIKRRINKTCKKCKSFSFW
jgi:protein disulfide-isomerase A1